jgi:hypothetical protein
MRRMAVVVLAVAMLSGCSFLMVRPSPRPLPRSPETKGQAGWTHCFGYGVPAAELVGGLLLGGMMAVSAAGSAVTCPSNDSHCGRSGGIAAAGVLGISVSSAIYGFVATAVCMDRLD